MSPPDVNGGGIAVLDFDLDGWSDLYFSQSGGIPNRSSGSHANQLFRHERTSDLAAAKFVEVTFASGTRDRGFGQGVCSGDLNHDGFADLVVGNFGANTIYLNQGDGTFVNASERLLDAANRWTSSVAVADLDGDHLPEIVEVNYIDDPRALDVECTGGDVRCQPQQFLAAADKIYQCQSNGTYRNWPGAIDMFDTRGLGFSVVIANFDRQNGNDMFVANDVGRNHFWTSSPSSPSRGSRFELLESAALKGLAVGANGDSQGCMGVAAGDETWTVWQTAGDGRMCSNESVLHVGLGDASSINELTIRWPSGQESHFQSIAPTHRYRVIEGYDECDLSF